MNFYPIDDITKNKHSKNMMNMMLMAKIFKDISKSDSLKTMDDIMGFELVWLEQGKLSEDNNDLAHKGQIKERKKINHYCLVKPGQTFTIEQDGQRYEATIINGNALIAPSGELQPLVDKEVEGFKDLTPEEMKVVQWLEVGRTGMSSLALCASIYPQFKGRHHKLEDVGNNIPHDISDFMRCQKFFEAVPEAKAKIDSARAMSDVWNALVDSWQLLEEKTAQEESKAVSEIIQQCKNEKKSIKPK